MKRFYFNCVFFCILTAGPLVGLAEAARKTKKTNQQIKAKAEDAKDDQPPEDPLQKILPQVTFECRGRTEGYYADVDFDCEVFHYCNSQGLRFTFLCPPKSKFNQKNLICDFDRFGKSACKQSVNYFHLNENIRPKDNRTNNRSLEVKQIEKAVASGKPVSFGKKIREASTPKPEEEVVYEYEYEDENEPDNSKDKGTSQGNKLKESSDYGYEFVNDPLSDIRKEAKSPPLLVKKEGESLPTAAPRTAKPSTTSTAKPKESATDYYQYDEYEDELPAEDTTAEIIDAKKDEDISASETGKKDKDKKTSYGLKRPSLAKPTTASVTTSIESSVRKGRKLFRKEEADSTEIVNTRKPALSLFNRRRPQNRFNLGNQQQSVTSTSTAKTSKTTTTTTTRKPTEKPLEIVTTSKPILDRPGAIPRYNSAPRGRSKTPPPRRTTTSRPASNTRRNFGKPRVTTTLAPEIEDDYEYEDEIVVDSKPTEDKRPQPRTTPESVTLPRPTLPPPTSSPISIEESEDYPSQKQPQQHLRAVIRFKNIKPKPRPQETQLSRPIPESPRQSIEQNKNLEIFPRAELARNPVNDEESQVPQKDKPRNRNRDFVSRPSPAGIIRNTNIPREPRPVVSNDEIVSTRGPHEEQHQERQNARNRNPEVPSYNSEYHQRPQNNPRYTSQRPPNDPDLNINDQNRAREPNERRPNHIHQSQNFEETRSQSPIQHAQANTKPPRFNQQQNNYGQISTEQPRGNVRSPEQINQHHNSYYESRPVQPQQHDQNYHERPPETVQRPLNEHENRQPNQIRLQRPIVEQPSHFHEPHQQSYLNRPQPHGQVHYTVNHNERPQEIPNAQNHQNNPNSQIQHTDTANNERPREIPNTQVHYTQNHQINPNSHQNTQIQHTTNNNERPREIPNRQVHNPQSYQNNPNSQTQYNANNNERPQLNQNHHYSNNNQQQYRPTGPNNEVAYQPAHGEGQDIRNRPEVPDEHQQNFSPDQFQFSNYPDFARPFQHDNSGGYGYSPSNFDHNAAQEQERPHYIQEQRDPFHGENPLGLNERLRPYRLPGYPSSLQEHYGERQPFYGDQHQIEAPPQNNHRPQQQNNPESQLAESQQYPVHAENNRPQNDFLYPLRLIDIINQEVKVAKNQHDNPEASVVQEEILYASGRPVNALETEGDQNKYPTRNQYHETTSVQPPIRQQPTVVVEEISEHEFQGSNRFSLSPTVRPFNQQETEVVMEEIRHQHFANGRRPQDHLSSTEQPINFQQTAENTEFGIPFREHQKQNRVPTDVIQNVMILQSPGRPRPVHELQGQHVQNGETSNRQHQIAVDERPIMYHVPVPANRIPEQKGRHVPIDNEPFQRHVVYHHQQQINQPSAINENYFNKEQPAEYVQNPTERPTNVPVNNQQMDQGFFLRSPPSGARPDEHFRFVPHEKFEKFPQKYVGSESVSSAYFVTEGEQKQVTDTSNSIRFIVRRPNEDGSAHSEFEVEATPIRHYVNGEKPAVIGSSHDSVEQENEKSYVFVMSRRMQNGNGSVPNISKIKFSRKKRQVPLYVNGIPRTRLLPYFGPQNSISAYTSGGNPFVATIYEPDAQQIRPVYVNPQALPQQQRVPPPYLAHQPQQQPQVFLGFPLTIPNMHSTVPPHGRQPNDLRPLPSPHPVRNLAPPLRNVQYRPQIVRPPLPENQFQHIHNLRPNQLPHAPLPPPHYRHVPTDNRRPLPPSAFPGIYGTQQPIHNIHQQGLRGERPTVIYNPNSLLTQGQQYQLHGQQYPVQIHQGHRNPYPQQNVYQQHYPAQPPREEENYIQQQDGEVHYRPQEIEENTQRPYEENSRPHEHSNYNVPPPRYTYHNPPPPRYPPRNRPVPNYGYGYNPYRPNNVQVGRPSPPVRPLPPIPPIDHPDNQEDENDDDGDSDQAPHQHHGRPDGRPQENYPERGPPYEENRRPHPQHNHENDPRNRPHEHEENENQHPESDDDERPPPGYGHDEQRHPPRGYGDDEQRNHPQNYDDREQRPHHQHEDRGRQPPHDDRLQRPQGYNEERERPSEPENDGPDRPHPQDENRGRPPPQEDEDERHPQREHRRPPEDPPEPPHPPGYDSFEDNESDQPRNYNKHRPKEESLPEENEVPPRSEDGVSRPSKHAVRENKTSVYPTTGSFNDLKPRPPSFFFDQPNFRVPSSGPFPPSNEQEIPEQLPPPPAEKEEPITKLQDQQSEPAVSSSKEKGNESDKDVPFGTRITSQDQGSTLPASSEIKSAKKSGVSGDNIENSFRLMSTFPGFKYPPPQPSEKKKSQKAETTPNHEAEETASTNSVYKIEPFSTTPSVVPSFGGFRPLSTQKANLFRKQRPSVKPLNKATVLEPITEATEDGKKILHTTGGALRGRTINDKFTARPRLFKFGSRPKKGSSDLQGAASAVEEDETDYISDYYTSPDHSSLEPKPEESVTFPISKYSPAPLRHKTTTEQTKSVDVATEINLIGDSELHATEKPKLIYFSERPVMDIPLNEANWSTTTTTTQSPWIPITNAVTEATKKPSSSSLMPVYRHVAATSENVSSTTVNAIIESSATNTTTTEPPTIGIKMVTRPSIVPSPSTEKSTATTPTTSELYNSDLLAALALADNLLSENVVRVVATSKPLT